MKVRQGFVSNSSSSSFVLVTTKKNHEDTLKKLPKYIGEIVKELGVEFEEFMGQQVAMIGWYQGGGGNSTLDCMSHCYDEDQLDEMRKWARELKNLTEHKDLPDDEFEEEMENYWGPIGSPNIAWEIYEEQVTANGDVITYSGYN